MRIYWTTNISKIQPIKKVYKIRQKIKEKDKKSKKKKQKRSHPDLPKTKQNYTRVLRQPPPQIILNKIKHKNKD